MNKFEYIDIAFANSVLGNDVSKNSVSENNVLKNNVSRNNDTIHSFLANLMKTSREGNLCILDTNIKHEIQYILDEENSPIVKYEDYYYLRRNFEMESDILFNIKRLLSNKPTLSNICVKDISEFYPTQNKALKLAVKNPITTISGGPGCGKTFFANKLIDRILSINPNINIIWTAPTGKAAARIKNTKIKTKTLHSLLEINEFHDFSKKPNPIIADVIIVDECSMIDIRIWYYLLSSIKSNCNLILMGDPNQLPPIEAGALFKDLIQIKQIPHIHLDKTMRTDRDSIQKLSNFIKDGDFEGTLNILNDKSRNDLSIHPLSENIDFSNQQNTCVLSPFCKGLHGTDKYNEIISKTNNTNKTPIIITQNDYKLNLMNGDIGYIENNLSFFNLNGEIKSFPTTILKEYSLGFAISIHRSQGSEFENIVLIIPNEAEVFGREMIYTAITRAKSSIKIYTNTEILKKILSKKIQHSSNILKRIN